MKYKIDEDGKDTTIIMEEGEPYMRSCWECNLAHEYLKKVNSLFLCFVCDKYWLFGEFLTSKDKVEELIAFFNRHGLKENMSSTEIEVQ